jgi:hypothetical protein
MRIYSDNGINSMPAVSITGFSSSSSSGTSPTTSPQISIYALSSMPWRVLRRRRFDQLIWHTSTSSMSPSTCLPQTEYRAAVASSFGSQHRLWSTSPASNAPSYACTSLVVTPLHRIAPCSYAAPLVVAWLHAVIFAVSMYRHPRVPRAASLGAGHQIHAWPLSRLRVLPRLLRAPPPRFLR